MLGVCRLDVGKQQRSEQEQADCRGLVEVAVQSYWPVVAELPGWWWEWVQ